MKILIADDHALFRDSLRSLLEAHGLEVVGEAKNGREACELARRLQPDVVLMDLSMPEVDGLAATRLISAELPAVKVVVLTASDDDAKLFEAIKSGAQGYLLKDLDSEDFFALLERTERGNRIEHRACVGALRLHPGNGRGVELFHVSIVVGHLAAP